MSIRSDKLHLSHLVTHETKRRALLKFALVVALFAGYFGVIAYRYGVKEGIFVTAGTWSFFVLCTPISVGFSFAVDYPRPHAVFRASRVDDCYFGEYMDFGRESRGL